MDILVCPGCRTRTAERLDVRTLDRPDHARDVLACACGRRYPIVDGVPIVLADPTGYLSNEMTTVVERDLDPEVAALLVEHGTDDAPYARLLEHVSIYMDNQWGDRATPPPDGPGAGFCEAILDKLRDRASHRVDLAVELGCSVGRCVAELARGAVHTVGLDLQFGAVRRARRLLAGEDVTYGRRTIGRNYARATATGIATANVTLICGDALDPPLIPAVYQRVVALNLLDSVRSPRQLLSVVDALCAPGGELILTSPYSWQSSYVDEEERFGGDDPATALADLLQRGHGLESRYALEEVAELPWTLRRDARSAATYCIHYIRARKGNAAAPNSV